MSSRLNDGSGASEQMPDEARLRELLVGKSVVRAEIKDESPERWTQGPTGYLTLSDGTVLRVWGNDGGCACSAGCYPLSSLNTCENVIMNVKVEDHPDGDDIPCEVCGKSWCWDHQNEGYYRIFVYAENDQLVQLASFDGSDGNGYYGTGWWLSVSPKTASEASHE